VNHGKPKTREQIHKENALEWKEASRAKRIAQEGFHDDDRLETNTEYKRNWTETTGKGDFGIG
jgi:hypothetical protein